MSHFLLPLLLLLSSAFGRPMMGVEWVPLSRGDLMWVDEGNTTGTGVGEFDGVLVPALRFRGGWEGPRLALLGGLSVARSTDTLWAGSGYSQSHEGALRLALDTRYALDAGDRADPIPWVEGGLYGVIPSARVVSDTYTEEEQATAEEGASLTRKTIGGVGLRVGPGFSWFFTDAMSLGATYHLVVFRGQVLTDASLAISTRVYGEAALLLEARFPSRHAEK